jgi:hypothetical protein
MDGICHSEPERPSFHIDAGRSADDRIVRENLRQLFECLRGTIASASMKASSRPVAIPAPPLRTAAIHLCSTETTRQPRSDANLGVSSVEQLSATIISTEPPLSANTCRAVSTESNRLGRSAASLYAGITKEKSGSATGEFMVTIAFENSNFSRKPLNFLLTPIAVTIRPNRYAINVVPEFPLELGRGAEPLAASWESKNKSRYKSPNFAGDEGGRRRLRYSRSARIVVSRSVHLRLWIILQRVSS